ncbi:MAG TPA: fibronectin type III domain-containing protein [Gemmatimonadales bacterium]|nr:fibronectin type III domain-containing protein [Gemmatimonadales bacterium]
MRTVRNRWLSLAGFALVAMGAAACSDDSNSPSGPTTPTGVTVTQLTLTSVRVSWNAVSGATGYIVERASAANPGVFAQVGGTIATTSYDDAAVTAGVAYSYRVAATDGSKTSSASTPVTFTTGVQAATITGNIAANRTLYKDTVYTLSGYVKVQPGATLTVQAGTKIVGDTTVLGSSLWILRGAKIDAQGTAAEPIVFTSARSPGNRAPGDWGGLIIIGNGVINRTGATILTEGPAAVSENYAGGNDNNDNSGTLRYVRIEFAGYDVSGGAGQELNALSSYAVGRGTTYEYIQTMAGLDDSFEFWGGAVDGRYLISYESGDDHFDWTEGYQGRNQFLIALQTQRLVPRPGAGVFSSDPRGFEGDGCDPAVSGCTVTATGTSTPFSNPVFANFTMIGPGQLAGIPADGNGGVWRRGTGGWFVNGILARWKGIAINIRDAWTDTLFVQRDSLHLSNLILAQNGFNYDTAGAGFGQTTNFPAGQLSTHQAFAANVAVDTLLGLNLNPAGLNWKPKAGSPATTGAGTVTAGKVAGYFGGTWTNTTYIGAADPAGTAWWQGWTAYNIN